MSIKRRIWMLPLMAALIFAIGIATQAAFSSSTARSLNALKDVDYPYLDATTQLTSKLDELKATIQSAVAEGEKKRLEEAAERAASMRKILVAVQGLEGRGAEGRQLNELFDKYFADAQTGAEIFLGTKQGDQASAVAAMQASQKALEAKLENARGQARESFDASLAQAHNGVSSSLYATFVSALVVLAGLGAGSYLVVGSVWRQLGSEPEYARDVMRKIAAGDLSVRIEVQPSAENSLLAAVRDMVNGLSAIVEEVRGGSSSIRTAAQEIAAGNLDLSERTERQAASLQRTTARMSHLTQMVQTNAESARQASGLAVSASDVASRGGQVVSEVVATMSDISASSTKIADIISVIDGIAFQTNILALNAAVEAARAGEQGRGFAVVAGEVRGLAHRSADAAREIKSLIGTSVTKVEAGSRLVMDAGQTMTAIVASVARVATLIDEITSAASQQSQGLSEVNSDVAHLEEMTQRNAALVEEAAAAASSMEQQSAGLDTAVATFKLPSDASA
jgi:methyl-accepting chemotaxis protein